MNAYRGVNPHFNSLLQSKGGGWDAFHAHFIQELTAYLDARLPDGYYATGERSLQVTRTDKTTRVVDTTVPDVIVLRSPSITRSTSSLEMAPNADVPFLVLPLEELPIEDELVMGVAVYRLSAGEFPSELVTRLELISPANKPDGSHYPHYVGKRLDTLLAGVCLVEIDFIHERRPFLVGVPSYPDHETDALPYIIIVNDPRPKGGRKAIYGTHVDAALPVVDVPLDKDTIRVDFDAIYQQTYSARRVYQSMTDMRTLPVRFQTYNDTDQNRIRERMASINTLTLNE